MSSHMDTKAKECSFAVLFVAGGWCGESLWYWEAYRNCLQSVRVSLEKKNPLRTMCPLSHIVHLQPWSGSCSGAVPWVGGHCWEMYGGVFGHHDIGEWKRAAKKLILYTNKCLPKFQWCLSWGVEMQEGSCTFSEQLAYLRKSFSL